MSINKKNDSHKYDDIINLPHPVSNRHQHMPIAARAAQFAPFAALTGHGAAINETARLTDEKIELDDTSKAILDEKLRYLDDNKGTKANDYCGVVAEFTYFVKDKKKKGGAYVSETGTLKKTDILNGTLTLTSGTVIFIDDIVQIDCEAFTSEGWL